MADYLECRDCGFVVQAASGAEAVPERVDACPDCEGTDFRFTE